MKKILRKMMSFVMAVFMVLQVMLPAFASSSKAEEEKPNSIKGLEEMKDDTDVYFSILKSQEIYDKSKKKKDENKFSIAISMPDTTSKFRLIKRNDLKLYEDGYFDTNEKASKEYWRVKDMLNSQGLDLDLEIIKEDEGYKIVTKEQLEKLEEDEDKNIYGQNYSYIDLKIMDDFDFNEKGIQKLFDEDKLLFNLEFIKYTSLDPNFELYEKDEKGNLKIKNQGDLFALIREDKIKLYNTNSLEEDYNKLKAYKEEKQTEQQKAQDKKEQENAPSQSQEEKVQDEKSSSNKENLSQDKKEQKNKEDTKENKESNTEVQVESKENTKENTENKDNKDSAQEPKKEEQKEKSSQKTQTQEKSEDKKEKKTTEKKGLMPKFRMLFLGQDEPAKVQVRANQNRESEPSLENNKFTIMTRFETSNQAGSIQPGQHFDIKLDDRLIVKDPKSLKPITYKNEQIATPSYNKKTNTITYRITKQIEDNAKIPLNIDVDYNVTKIRELDGDAKKHSIQNTISGTGVKETKLPQVVVDDKGNVINTIAEPGSHQVLEIVDQGEDYQVYMDANGTPVLTDGELTAIDWTVHFSATKDLLDLGLISNATLVKGSGLKNFENIILNGKPIDSDDITTNEIEGKFGIRESKNHTLKESTKDVVVNFQTPIMGKQQTYMIDFSVLLKNRGKTGAVRLLFDKGYPEQKVKDDTSIRIGMNNRTTIMGEFTSNDSAKWTVTDGVSTGDENHGLPLQTRELSGKQSLTSSKMAVYGIDTTTGKMVEKIGETDLNKTIPEKETNPSEPQLPGRIAVYEYKTNIDEDEAGYTLAGVNINKYEDVKVNQSWNKLDTQKIPDQKIIVEDEKGNTIKTIDVPGETDYKSQRDLVLDKVKTWNISADGKEEKINHKLIQEFPADFKDGTKTYTYTEVANYQKSDDKVHHLVNWISEKDESINANFTIVKTDAKDGNKKLSGATFKLENADGVREVITDDNGQARFSNVKPGTYVLSESKAPTGYKLDQEEKEVKVSKNGKVSVSGNNVSITGGKTQTQSREHNQKPNWPDYMNSMDFAKIDGNGNITSYIYLKPRANYAGGSTNRDTRLNLNVNGGKIQTVEVFDVDPYYRDKIVQAMKDQGTVENAENLGSSVLNKGVDDDITANTNVKDPYTGKTGTQIKFPKQRFTNDWGFLVKVTATGNKSTSVSYDWLTDPPQDTSKNAMIQADVNISSADADDNESIIKIQNEELPKQSVKIIKVDDDRQKRNPLANANFVLKDKEGKVLKTVITGVDGQADFGKLPAGTYRIEEEKAPRNHNESDVYFEVNVSEGGSVKYTAKFLDGVGTPTNGIDYYIENKDIADTGEKLRVLNASQEMTLPEGPGSGSIGQKPGVWEAYEFESLHYHAEARIEGVRPGSVFKIQFDPNLNFVQYVYEIPDLRDENGQVIAKAYFDYQTNLLTYIFTENQKQNFANFKLDINGIIPDKYWAQYSGKWTVTNILDPDGVAQKNSYTIDADYEWYWNQGPGPLTANYYTDIYEENGEKYFKGVSYYNAVDEKKSKAARTLRYDWISAIQKERVPRMENYPADGPPAYELDNMQIYKVYPYKDYYNGPNGWKTELVNTKFKYMPLSYGVRPEKNPEIYNLVYSRDDFTSSFQDRQSNLAVRYNKDNIKSSGTINQYNHARHPLEIDVPAISNADEGYVIMQTFKVTDFEKYKQRWRLYYMSDGNRQTASYQKGNYNSAAASQSGKEIPKTYVQIVKLPNFPYTAGKFKIKKTDQSTGKDLRGAVFTLTSKNGNTINRSTDNEGIVNFTELAPGTYTLIESKAPEGYKKLETKWQVIVNDDGNVRITENSITGVGGRYEGKDLTIPVSNKPTGTKFRVYKKDNDGKALQGAKFAITDKKETTTIAEGISNANGLVEFNKELQDGTYVLKEIETPKGYKKLDQKWVLEVSDGKTKVYTYVLDSTQTDIKSILAQGGNWINVKGRDTSKFTNYDNRWTGWAGNNQNARYLGTRIIAINEEKKYVVQRFIINPEASEIEENTKVSIHREKPQYDNMTWYDGDAEYKVFKLDKPVTGLISDVRLANYNVEDITDEVKKSEKAEAGRYGEPNRLAMTLPHTKQPIVVDVKVPYRNKDGGVGLGLDWYSEDNQIYWKSDYYEKVSDIKKSDPIIGEAGNIKGTYISEDSLDVTNEKERFQFKVKKVRKLDPNQAIEGATFKLIGPDPSQDERYMTTDKKGMITFTNLEPGTYTLVEESPASGYEKVDTDWTVTITAEGKTFIKQNNQNAQNTSLLNSKSERSLSNKDNVNEELINNRSYYLARMAKDTRDENEGLEISEINPRNLLENAQRAESDWENIDPARSEKTHLNPTKSTDDPVVLETRMTQINKVDKKFRQVFLFGQTTHGKKTRKIEIHSQPEEFDVRKNPPKQATIKVYQVTGDSLDNIGTKTDITNKVVFDQYHNGKKFRIRAKTVNANITGNILVEVETYYDETKGIGLGTDYISDTTNPRYSTNWIGESYASEDKINKGPVITYDYVWKFENDIQPSTIDVPESEKYEDETWTVEGKAGKLYRKYKRELADGVATGNEEKTEETKEDPAPVPNEYHHGTKKRPESRTTNPVSLTKEIPFDTITTDDPNLKQGEIEVDVDGENGQAEYKYSVTFDRKNEPDAQKPADWPENLPVPEKQAGERIAAYNIEFVREIKPKVDKKQRRGTRVDGEELLDNTATITNKQTGIEFKILKQKSYGKYIKGAKFTIKKYTDKTYTTVDKKFEEVTATSDKDGLVRFIDKNGEVVKLQKDAYYQVEEVEAPVGYKKIPAPWKLHVIEEKGQLIIKSTGPEYTPANYVASDKAKAGENLNDSNAQIKYSSKITNIDTTLGTYVQRIYIDTRGYTGNEKINVQINPVIKRDERDYGTAAAPTTETGGVKTAYRTTYKIKNPDGVDINEVLNKYDISNQNVSMVNTARWRPFDWGFDEDQLNIEKGVYFIDIEGYFDRIPKNRDDIKKLENIDIKIDFYEGERKFQHRGGADKNYDFVDGGSYQLGNINLGVTGDTNFGKMSTSNKEDPNKKGKYPNYLSKGWYDARGTWWDTGRIYPAIGDKVGKLSSVTTSANINSLYESNNSETVDNEGLRINNEQSDYNITFSKHGRDEEGLDINDPKITKNRLEGAVFKIQTYLGPQYGWEDVEGKYVSSAFNGYFGFRGLKEGRYRVLEVKAPNGYKQIKDPIIDFNIEVSKEDLVITDPTTGYEKIIPKGNGYIRINYQNKSIYHYDGKETDGKLIDYVTAATAKNMGKIINEKPGKGKISVNKVDDKGKSLKGFRNQAGDLIGAKFKLTRTSAKKNEDGEPVSKSEYTETIGEDGNLTFEGLPIGNYRLEEIESPPGYVKSDSVWNFTIGGDKLDPYSGPIQRTGKNLTDSIEMTDSSIEILRPHKQKGDNTTGNDEIRPHLGQSMLFENKFKPKDGLYINPGDYFVLNLSDNIDLWGILRNENKNIDIFADGVGTIAKGEYDRENNRIIYTFTDYARQFELIEFSNALTAHINLYKVQNSSTQKLGMRVGNDTKNYKNMRVTYDPEMAENIVGNTHLNMASKITSFDVKTGKFEQYFYINKLRKTSGPLNFYYRPNQLVTNLEIETQALNNNSGQNINLYMPESFGVDDNSPGTTKYHKAYWESVPKGGSANYLLERSNVSQNDSYIVKVTGYLKVGEETDYESTVFLEDAITRYYVQRVNSIYVFKQKNTGEAKFSIKAINKPNKILFKKVDSKKNPLKGATFGLYKKDTKDGIFKYVDGFDKESQEDGTFGFDHLEEGDYQVQEFNPPTGYKKIEGAVYEFTVEKTGRIVRKIVKEDGSEQVEEISSTVPIEIVNLKEQIIKFKKTDQDGKQLAGAEFELHYKENPDADYEKDKFVLYKENNGKGRIFLKKSEKAPLGYTKSDDNILKSGDDGLIEFKFYENGYYALKEVKAPDGYSKVDGFVREFAIIDGKLRVKSQASVGNIKKDEKSTDANDTVAYATLTNRTTSGLGLLEMYYVINPNNEEKTYSDNDKFIIDYINNTDNRPGNVEVYRLKKGEKPSDKTKADANIAANLPTEFEGKRVEFSLKELAGAKKSSDKIVIKVNALDYGVARNDEIKTSLIANGKTVEAMYSFNSGRIPANLKALLDNIEKQKQNDEKSYVYVDYVEPKTDNSDVMQIINRKVSLPMTNGIRAWIGFTIIGLVLMILAAYYYNKKKNKALEIEKN